MTRSNLIFVCGFLLFALSGCSRSGQNSATTPPESPKISSESVVKVSVTPIEIKGGDSKEAVVNVATQSGYHINANPPSFDYLKATELDLEDTPEILVDYIYYPNPEVKKFAFAEESIRVYEGETQLKVMLNADKSAPKGPRSLAGKLNVQACDEKVCYPPGALDVVIPVTIK